MELLKIYKSREVKTPTRGTDEAAGLDFYIPTDLNEKTLSEKMQTVNSWPLINYDLFGHMLAITLKAGQSILIPSGIHIKLANGYCMEMKNKSGVASKKHMLRGAELIDQDYEGEIHINLHNVGNDEVILSAGEKIIQGVIYAIERPTLIETYSLAELYENSNSIRKDGCLGSTGVK